MPQEETKKIQAKPCRKTPEEIIRKHLEGIYIFPRDFDFESKKILLEGINKAMEEYAEQQSDIICKILTKPQEELRPLEDLWRKEHPREDGAFVIPDATMFYKWIVGKIIKKD